MIRFGRLVRDVIQVLRGRAPDEVVRHQTMAIQEQISRLRVARAAREKRLEDEALLKLQSVVEEMQQLKESLIAAEAAVVEHVDQIGREAEAQLQEDWSTKENTVMAGVMNSQQTVVVTKAHEQVHADLSLKKEAFDDSQCNQGVQKQTNNSSDKVLSPSP
ncbi:unnamed protein product [Sphagnum troendelagicum]|uniref:Uncharacterized protein n=1 Tax=Sphagnum troendelagicum TaxID=128251 RepID=A0ABP0TQ73_9BRYO